MILKWKLYNLGDRKCGFTVPFADRDRFITRTGNGGKVTLRLHSHGEEVPAETLINVDKDSFWKSGDTAASPPELSNAVSIQWVRNCGMADYPARKPPVAIVEPLGENVFAVYGFLPAPVDEGFVRLTLVAQGDG